MSRDSKRYSHGSTTQRVVEADGRVAIYRDVLYSVVHPTNPMMDSWEHGVVFDHWEDEEDNG